MWLRKTDVKILRWKEADCLRGRKAMAGGSREQRGGRAAGE